MVPLHSRWSFCNVAVLVAVATIWTVVFLFRYVSACLVVHCFVAVSKAACLTSPDYEVL